MQQQQQHYAQRCASTYTYTHILWSSRINRIEDIKVSLMELYCKRSLCVCVSSFINAIIVIFRYITKCFLRPHLIPLALKLWHKHKHLTTYHIVSFRIIVSMLTKDILELRKCLIISLSPPFHLYFSIAPVHGLHLVLSILLCYTPWEKSY